MQPTAQVKIRLADFNLSYPVPTVDHRTSLYAGQLEFVCELCKMSGSHTNIDGAYNRRHPCRQLVSNALFHRVHGWTRYKSPAMFLRSKNSKFKNWHGCQSICNISTLNYCKLTFEFFKNYIFEKRRQFLKKQSKGNAQKLCLT